MSEGPAVITMRSKYCTKTKMEGVMSNEPGSITLGAEGVLCITIDGEIYYLTGKDVRSLLFNSRVVPIIQTLRRKQGDEQQQNTNITIEGHAAINRAGKAVIFYTRLGHFIIPLISIQRVASGEAISAPLFPLIPYEQGDPA